MRLILLQSTMASIQSKTSSAGSGIIGQDTFYTGQILDIDYE